MCPKNQTDFYLPHWIRVINVDHCLSALFEDGREDMHSNEVQGWWVGEWHSLTLEWCYSPLGHSVRSPTSPSKSPSASPTKVRDWVCLMPGKSAKVFVFLLQLRLYQAKCQGKWDPLAFRVRIMKCTLVWKTIWSGYTLKRACFWPQRKRWPPDCQIQRMQTKIRLVSRSCRFLSPCEIVPNDA